MQHNLEKGTIEIETVVESLNNDGADQENQSRVNE